jgi:hypothetical protein
MPRRAPLCSALPGAYFQILSCLKPIVRDASWVPLRGVQPLRSLLWLNHVQEPVDRGRCEVCCASFLQAFHRTFAHAHFACFMPCVGGDGFPQRKPPKFLPTCMHFLYASCLHVLFVHHVSCTCSHVCPRARNAKCPMHACRWRLTGMRHLRRAQDAQRLCADDGAFRRLSILKKYLVNLTRARGLCHGTCLRRECRFFTSTSKLRI